MRFIYLVFIALALAMDAFAVSVGMSAAQKRISKIQALRLAFSFGIFQFGMPVLGWLAGEGILTYIQAFDHWVAFGLLMAIGSRMVFKSFRQEGISSQSNIDPTQGLPLLLLSVATSLDALAAGLSFAVLKQAVFFPAAIIGITAFALTLAGATWGPLLGQLIGKRAELAGGLVFVAIGIKILTDHLS